MRENSPRSQLRLHRDRQIAEVVHDPYFSHDKPEGTLICPHCKLIYRNGRWRRVPQRPLEARSHQCPACHRISDQLPAGFVTLSGKYVAANRSELLKLTENEASRAASRHPLQRIMDIEDRDAVITVTTTDVHLARRIGEALHRAHQGTLEIKYSPDQYLVRVDWSR